MTAPLRFANAGREGGLDRFLTLRRSIFTNFNEAPKDDMLENTTGCCSNFNPEGWHGQELHFRDKPMVRAVTMSRCISL